MKMIKINTIKKTMLSLTILMATQILFAEPSSFIDQDNEITQTQVDATKKIKVFGLQGTNFTNLNEDASVCYLDLYQNQLNQINQNFLSQTNTGITYDQYVPQLQSAMQSYICRYDAKKLGIEKIPAIVIDDHYVFYGETDIQTALNEYQTFLKEKTS